MNTKFAGISALAIPPLLTVTVALFGAGSGTLTPADAALTGCLAAVTDDGQAGATLDTLEPAQLGNARIIYAVAAQRGLPKRAVVIALATALQESTLRNLTGGDRDSLGLFQQRPSQGWGTPAQILDPAYAAGIFYDHLVRIPAWQALPVTVAAQRVQGSAFPNAYAKWEPLATQLATTLGATGPSPLPASGSGQCATVNCPESTADDTTQPSPGSQPAACRDAAAVFVRAATWLTAWNGGPVPYLSSGDAASWLGGYRRDCSGYASMALGLPGPGLNVRGLVAQSARLTKAALRAGDLLANPTPGAGGHVVIFERWTDSSMTKYLGYEQSGDGGTHHRAIPYPYFGSYPMTPYRFMN